MLNLNNTGSSITQAERALINENWLKISNAMNTLNDKFLQIKGADLITVADRINKLIPELQSQVQATIETGEADLAILNGLIADAQSLSGKITAAINQANNAAAAATNATAAANTAKAAADTATAAANTASTTATAAAATAQTAVTDTQAATTAATTAASTAEAAAADAATKAAEAVVAADNANAAAAKAAEDVQTAINQAQTDAVAAIEAAQITAADQLAEATAKAAEDVQSATNNAAATVEALTQTVEEATAAAEAAIGDVEAAIQLVQDGLTDISEAITAAGHFEHKGDFDVATAYKKRNIVTYFGSSFMALQDTTGKTPPTLPTTRNEYWTLVAQRGVDGTGSVVSVNGLSPDVNGNVQLDLTNSVEAIVEGHTSNNDIHVTPDERAAWNAKLNASALQNHENTPDIHVSTNDRATWDAKAEAHTATTFRNGLQSAADKAKLDGIEAGATKTIVENTLESTSETNALSAAQGAALKELIDSHAAAAQLTDDEYQSLLYIIDEWQSGILGNGDGGGGTDFVNELTEVMTPAMFSERGVGIYLDKGISTQFGLPQGFGSTVFTITFVLNSSTSAAITQLIFNLANKIYLRTGRRDTWNTQTEIGLSAAHAKEIASATALGHVKVGEGLAIASDGTLSAAAAGGGDTLIATPYVKGTLPSYYQDKGIAFTIQIAAKDDMEDPSKFEGDVTLITYVTQDGDDLDPVQYAFDFAGYTYKRFGSDDNWWDWELLGQDWQEWYQVNPFYDDIIALRYGGYTHDYKTNINTVELVFDIGQPYSYRSKIGTLPDEAIYPTFDVVVPFKVLGNYAYGGAVVVQKDGEILIYFDDWETAVFAENVQILIQYTDTATYA